MKTLLGTVLAVAVAGLSLPALAGEAKVGAIEITSAWARATPAKAPAGAAYVTVANTGATTDNLIGAAADVSKVAELHTHVHQGDVMRMMAVGSIELQPGKPVAMGPGGLHIMLINLKQPLKEGTSFPLELTFAQAGKVSVTVDVLPVGSPGPAAAAPAHQGHSGH